MKKQEVRSETIWIAAAAGALAAGAVIAVYEVLKTEKAQAGIAKVKAGVISTATKAKAGVVSTAAKAKETVVRTVTTIKSKVAGKTAADTDIAEEIYEGDPIMEDAEEIDEAIEEALEEAIEEDIEDAILDIVTE